MNSADRRKIFERLRAANPKPTTELRYRNSYQLLVAVTLSAQATDKSVNAATLPLFARVKTPADMLRFGEEKLRESVRTIGLFRTKAKNIVAAAKILLEKHGGEIPRDRESLESLPGVGRKTANVILNTAFGEPTIAVDTHIFRLANRTGIAPGKNPREVESHLVKVVPAEFARDAHHWLILHGRYICQSRKPKCAICRIADLCEYPQKTSAA